MRKYRHEILGCHFKWIIRYNIHQTKKGQSTFELLPFITSNVSNQMLALQECPNTKEGTIFSLWNIFRYKHPEKYANEMLNYTSCGKIPKGLNDHNCSNTHSPLALFTNKNMY